MTFGAAGALELPALAVAGAGVVQVVDYPAGSTFGPRRLDDHELLWIEAGSAAYTVQRAGADGTREPTSTLPLRPGTLLLAPAGALDSFVWDAARTTRHAWVHFRVTDAADLPQPSSWPLTRSMATAPVLGALCAYLVELGARSGEEARNRSDQLLALLLDLFVRGPFEGPAAVPAPTPGPLADALAAVRQIWRTDGVRLVEVSELAAAAHVSVGHLYRTFRRRYGCGPAHALELVRLSRAAVILQRSNASLVEVARATGFANPYHLSRRFRAAYGVPPGAYRRDQPHGDTLAPLRAAGLLAFASAVTEG